MPDFGDHRIMACTRADLQRWLREFTGDPSLQVGDHALELALEGFNLTLNTRELPPRRIALLRIEQLEVQFDYATESAARARDWIARFDRHTQRGGG